MKIQGYAYRARCLKPRLGAGLTKVLEQDVATQRVAYGEHWASLPLVMQGSQEIPDITGFAGVITPR